MRTVSIEFYGYPTFSRSNSLREQVHVYCCRMHEYKFNLERDITSKTVFWDQLLCRNVQIPLKGHRVHTETFEGISHESLLDGVKKLYRSIFMNSQIQWKERSDSKTHKQNNNHGIFNCGLITLRIDCFYFEENLFGQCLSTKDYNLKHATKRLQLDKHPFLMQAS